MTKTKKQIIFWAYLATPFITVAILKNTCEPHEIGIIFWRVRHVYFPIGLKLGAAFITVGVILGFALAAYKIYNQFRCKRANRLERLRQEAIEMHNREFSVYCDRAEREMALESTRLDLEKKKAGVNKAYLDATVINFQNDRQSIFYEGAGQYRDFTSVRSSRSTPALTQTPELIANMPELLPAVQNCDRFLIYGRTGAGKTTLIKQLIGNSDAIILDPKKTGFSGWSRHPNCSIYCKNDAWEQTEIAIDHFLQVYSTRLNSTQSINQLPFWVVIDEHALFVHKIPDFVNRLTEIALCQGRQYGIKLIIASQGSTAMSTGFKGRMDLMKNFDADIELKKVHDNRYASVDFGDGMRENYSLPMPSFNNAESTINLGSNAGLLCSPALSDGAMIILNYMRRKGGSIKRHKLMISRALGNHATTPDYDRFLDELLVSGRIDCKKERRMNDWEYRLTI